VSRFLVVVTHATIPKTHNIPRINILDFLFIFCIDLLHFFPGLITALVALYEGIKRMYALALAICVQEYCRHKKDRAGN